MRIALNFLLGVLWGVVITAMAFQIYNDITPTAMDVYKGKTTLEITYKGDIPVDSVVVFKY